MKLLMILLLLILTSCGSGNDGTAAGAAASCSATKSVFSTWTSRTSGKIYLMQAGSFNTNLQVMFGSAPCSDGRGDFTIYIQPNGRLGLSNCADTSSSGGANWTIGCDNLLKITYDSDSSVEIFD